MKLMILLLISLLLATSVEAGKKKCTKCTNKFEAAKKKFNKCERKASCPSPPLRGSVCNPPPSFGQCGAGIRYPSGLECKCFTIPVHGLPEEICTCEPKSPYLDTVCLAPPAVGTCGGGILPPPGQDPSGLTCQCEIFCPGCQETCTCRPEQPPPPVPPPSPSPPPLSPPCTDEPAKNCKKKKCKKSYSDEEKQQCKKTCDLCDAPPPPVPPPSPSPPETGSPCCYPCDIFPKCGPIGNGLICVLDGEQGTCEPESPYLDTVCLAPPAVGTCGTTLPDPSGLTCQCEGFGPTETCTCRPAVA